MFHFWFNTGFVSNNFLSLDKMFIDKACKDKEHKKFDPNFKVELYLHRVNKDIDFSKLENEIEQD